MITVCYFLNEILAGRSILDPAIDLLMRRALDENDEKAFHAPPLTKYLVAALVVIHILLQVTDQETLAWVFTSFAFDLDKVGVWLSGGDVGAGAVVFNLVSHMFLHHDFMHLLINAFMLLGFGAMVERYYGVPTFITVFVLTGAAGALFELMVSGTDSGGLLYGASGAVFGMMGATCRLMLPRLGMQKVFAFAAVMMGVNLVIGLSPLGQMIAGGDATISWAAHLGGFLMGVLLSLIFRPSAES